MRFLTYFSIQSIFLAHIHVHTHVVTQRHVVNVWRQLSHRNVWRRITRGNKTPDRLFFLNCFLISCAVITISYTELNRNVD